MKLWILGPITGMKDDPWEPWYDKAFGFVVRAETEDAARQFAHASAGDENDGGWVNLVRVKRTPWLDPAYSTCEPLTDEGEAGVVLQDFRAA